MIGRIGVICLTLGSAILLPLGLSGQVRLYNGGIQTRSQVTQLVDESKLAILPGNTRFEANQANDRGRVADSLPMEHLWLQLQRPPEVEKELRDLIDRIHEPASPDYHHWLTADELGRRFGPSPQDMDRITGWLGSHGFQVNGVQTSGLVVDFSGNAGQVRTAFHTEIHNLSVNGEPHISNMRDPQIPIALADVVLGVVSLHNFMPHPKLVKRTQFDVTLSGSPFEVVAPPDLATIYNLKPLFAAGFTGTGQTIAVIEDTNVKNASDWTTFRTAFGLSGYTSGSFTQVHPAGTTTCSDPGVNGDEGEAALDAEWASASAPNASIVLASCDDTTTVFGGLIALQNLLNAGSPPAIVSISYGECESMNGASANQSYVNVYQQAAAMGVSVFVAAGDEGAASCDANRTVATHGIAVSGFASTPYNVAVGGTDFSDFYSGTINTYWNATNNSTFQSAISYIPEIPWNDSCAGQLLVMKEGFTVPYGSSGFCNSTTGKSFRTTGAGSGGPSTFSTKPSWQNVLGNPADGHRDIPDVSLFAADGLWGHFFVFCLTDAAEGGAPCDYTNATDVNALAAGGTSFSAPIMAGIMALINQKTGSSQGNPNPRLYALAGAEYGASGSSACNSSLGNAVGSNCFFYDVTLGDITVNCAGSTNCFGTSGSGSSAVHGALSTSGTTYSPAYPTTAGWDFATGIGTINAYNLVYGWVAAATTITVTSGLNPSYQGVSVTFTASIASQNPGVSGTVAWSSNTGCGTTPVTTGNPGISTCTTSGLSVGSDTVTATYSSDISHLGGLGSVTQQVNAPVAPTVTFTGAPASAGYNTTFTVTATTNASTVASLTASGACSISGNTVTMTSGTGTCSLTASWAADTMYTSATANQSTAAAKITPTVTFTGAPGSAAYNSTFTVASTTNASTTASITPTGACSIATGTVTMTSGTGTCSLTANWAADNNYATATANQSTTAAKIAPTVTFTGAPASAAYNSTFTVASTTNASVTASITPSGACSIATVTVTMTSGTGTCSLTATWAADNNYTTGTANQSTTATKIAPTVTFTGAPGSAAYNSTFTVASTTNASTTASITPSGACSIATSTVTMTSGTGTCSLTANWAADNNYTTGTANQSTTATKITPTVTFTGAPGSAAYNSTFTVASTTNASTTASITPSGACSIATSTVTMTSGTGTCSLTASWAADNNYTTGTANQSTTATKIAPTVTFTGAPGSAAYKATFTVASTTNASTTASITPTGACSIATGTVTMTSGTGTCSLAASWAADNNYSSATANQSTTATKIAPSVTFTGAPGSAAYNSTFTVASTTNASTSASITPSGACSILSTTVTMTSGTGTCSLAASWAADNNYNSTTANQTTTASKLTPLVSWATPAVIIFGGALGNGQLNATASIPGAFVYNPPAGTVLPIGNGQTLSVAFTPQDTADYNGSTGSATINVNPASVSPANIIVTRVLSRASNNVVILLTFANNGGTEAANVTLTSANVGATAGTPLPQSLGSIAAGGSVQATVTVPGSVGASGAASSLSVGGSYTGGTFSSSARITLP